MSRLNKIILVGTVTSDTNTSVTNSGDAVTNFSLSVDRPQSETAPNQTDQFTIVAWRDLSETASTLNINNTVIVEGSIRNRSYDNNEGQRVYVTEIEARSIKPLTSTTPINTPNQNEAIIEQVEPAHKSEEVFDFNEAIKEDPQTNNVMSDFSKEIGEDVPF